MMNKKASVAKWVALAVAPVSLAMVLANVAERRQREVATEKLFTLLDNRNATPAEVEELIRQRADVNGRDHPMMMTPLHCAAYSAPSTIQVLLDHGADVNAQAKNGDTALSYAAFNGHGDAVRQLLSKGANCNLLSRLGEREFTTLSQTRTALTMKRPPANRERYLEIIQLLKAAGAKE